MPGMPDQPLIRLVDSRGSSSVSFAPPDPVALGPRGRTPTRAPIAVGPGRATETAPNRVRVEPRGGVTYPIQPGKIQAPALRDETLARMRLLDWLDVKIHSRVVFLIADAGYGKTTLLADFSRRSRLRTIWYRIDEDDRDWVGFLAHLVSAGREFEPEFAPRTAGILRSLEPGGPTREDAVETFLEELPSIASDGAALILDDFHLADEVADIRSIVRAIVARGPERLSIVFASRRPPSVPVAKLRSLGELAELGITDLRFSDAEMEQLFRETYGRPLEPDVLSDLAQRTEGWAASLTLVQAALRERTPAETRSFVRGLSGARDELHDYLAEEVVGELPGIQQQFLMRTSILQRVTPELAQVATGLSAIEVQSMVAEAERLGMLGRRANRRSSEQRYHPLVREFLEDRLRQEVGERGVDALHVAVARWAEPNDWQTAAHHFGAARQQPETHRVLENHLETIVASGAFTAAAEFLPHIPTFAGSPTAHVLQSRAASVTGDFEQMVKHAQAASIMSPESDVVVANLIAADLFTGDFENVVELAERFADTATSTTMRAIARATVSVIGSSLDGNLDETAVLCEQLAEQFSRDGSLHFEGVSWLNAALAHAAAGRLANAHSGAIRAVDALLTSSSGSELVSAWSLEAAMIALRGDIETARIKFRSVLPKLTGGPRTEFLAEFAEVEALVGDSGIAEGLLATIDRGVHTSSVELLKLVDVLLAVRRMDFQDALRRSSAIQPDRPSPNIGFQSRLRATNALVSALSGRAEAADIADDAFRYADAQGARGWRSLASLVRGCVAGTLNAAISELTEDTRYVLSFAAELVVPELPTLDSDATAAVTAQARSLPQRWRPTLRHEIEVAGSSVTAAARLLDQIGEAKDVALLRRVARKGRFAGSDRLLGGGLARRLAPPVVIRDLGRVVLSVGDDIMGASQVRRKVLALLCFLLTRPRWAANREEVMEAMWPDMDPGAATNSLNQSVYFLRRVFEAEFSEETTAGYVQQDSDVLWLDSDLIRASSGDSAVLVREYERTHDPRYAVQLSETYTGKFALDFAYEDWSADFREWLHIAYLQVIETQIGADMDSGQFRRGLQIAKRAVAVEPRNDGLELSLLRLLRGAGAHTAAAEQFSRYANVLRSDLGVEPPSPDSI